jgi:hypothetical protein
MTDLFTRLNGGRPPADEPEKPTVSAIVQRGPYLVPPAHRKSDPSEILLSWLINYWDKPTVTLRDVSAYGPNCVRDPKDVLRLTEVLTRFGWLVPAEAWRRDMKKWRVVREPGKGRSTSF